MSRWMNELEADTARRLLSEADLPHTFLYEPRKGYYVRIRDRCTCFLLREVRAYLRGQK